MSQNKMPVHITTNGKILWWGQWRIGRRVISEIYHLDICPVWEKQQQKICLVVKEAAEWQIC